MPKLSCEQLTKILDFFNDDIKNYPVFVETGTYMGETILGLSEFFELSYTVELDEVIFNNFSNLNYDRQKIKSYLGDSIIVLPEIIKLIDKNCIFFLDGHYSGSGTGKGIKDVPILEEIKSINDNYNLPSIIIIDDLRLFNTNYIENWSGITIESINSLISNRIIDTLVLEDRYILKIKKI